jgi:hypothetical protein
MIEKLQNIDRRIIFVLVLIGIALPLLNPIGLPVKITYTTQAFFDTIDALPDGSTVVMAVDYSPGAAPEVEPQCNAVARHLFYDKDVNVIFVSIVTTGPMFTEKLLTSIEGHDRVYGEDYVHLGYLAGEETAISAMAQNFKKAYPTDFYGTPSSDLPVLDGITDASDVDAFMVFTASEPSQYVRQIEGKYGTPLAVGINAVIFTTNLPYLDSGQIFGIINGLTGAAEYELLIGRPGIATAGMDALSATHLIVLFFIIAGNIIRFLGDGKKKNEKKGA